MYPPQCNMSTEKRYKFCLIPGNYSINYFYNLESSVFLILKSQIFPL